MFSWPCRPACIRPRTPLMSCCPHRLENVADEEKVWGCCGEHPAPWNILQNDLLDVLGRRPGLDRDPHETTVHLNRSLPRCYQGCVQAHTHSIHTTEQHEELSRVHDLVFHWSLHSLVLNKNTVQVLSEFSTRNDLIHRDLGCAVYSLRRITADLMFTFDWFSILCLSHHLTTPTPLFSPASQRVIYLPFRHYIMWDSLCLRHPHDRKRNHESLCARSNYLPRQIWSFSKIVDTCLRGLVEFSQWGLIPKLTFWSFSRTSCYLSIYLYRTLSRHFKLKPQASII